MAREKQRQNDPVGAPGGDPMGTDVAAPGRFAGQTRTVAAGTLVSRLLGIVREQVIAYYFGAGAVTDAFVAAFRIPNLLRDFFAEGAFSAAYVPTFTSVLKKEGRQAAFALLNRVLTVFSVILAVICLIGIAVTPQIAWIFAGGVEETPGKIALLIDLARLMFPFLLLVSLAAVLMGALNAMGRFGVPALAPAGFNVGMIGGAVILSRFVDPPIVALAWGVLAGGLLQWGVQAMVLRRMGHRYRWDWGWRDPRVRQIARLMVPAVVGTAAVQVNIMAITRFAWSMGDGPVTYLNFAFRVLFVPLGVFAVAAATVGLPRLSERVAAGDWGGTKAIWTQAIQTVFYLVTPVMIAFLLMGEPICAALFERGRFGAEATAHTARALFFYSLGLPAMATVRVTAPLFFAHHDTRTPMICGVSSVVVNLILMTVLIGPLGYAGLALSVASAAVVQIGLLLFLARRRFGPLSLLPAFGHLLVFAAAGWLGVRVGVWILSAPFLDGIPFGTVGATVVAVGTAAIVYLLITWLLGYRQMGSVYRGRGR
ncbi:MAG TPA: murein biosynthesis integral membrane protein MurJ [Acidobacteriota bacterium]|nr:murein biosynthesis integral membrane protein MurJ [Acidobacteriota bacterium]